MSAVATSIEILLLLIAVGALAYFALLGRARAASDSSALKLVGRLALEPRKSIYLVRVADTVLVVGASEHGLVKLAEVDGAKIADPPPAARPALRDLLGGRP